MEDTNTPGVPPTPPTNPIPSSQPETHTESISNAGMSPAMPTSAAPITVDATNVHAKKSHKKLYIVLGVIVVLAIIAVVFGLQYGGLFQGNSGSVNPLTNPVSLPVISDANNTPEFSVHQQDGLTLTKEASTDNSNRNAVNIEKSLYKDSQVAVYMDSAPDVQNFKAAYIVDNNDYSKFMADLQKKDLVDGWNNLSTQTLAADSATVSNNSIVITLPQQLVDFSKKFGASNLIFALGTANSTDSKQYTMNADGTVNVDQASYTAFASSNPNATPVLKVNGKDATGVEDTTDYPTLTVTFPTQGLATNAAIENKQDLTPVQMKAQTNQTAVTSVQTNSNQKAATPDTTTGSSMPVMQAQTDNTVKTNDATETKENTLTPVQNVQAEQQGAALQKVNFNPTAATSDTTNANTDTTDSSSMTTVQTQPDATSTNNQDSTTTLNKDGQTDIFYDVAKADFPADDSAQPCIPTTDETNLNLQANVKGGSSNTYVTCDISSLPVGGYTLVFDFNDSTQQNIHLNITNNPAANGNALNPNNNNNNPNGTPTGTPGTTNPNGTPVSPDCAGITSVTFNPTSVSLNKQTDSTGKLVSITTTPVQSSTDTFTHVNVTGLDTTCNIKPKMIYVPTNTDVTSQFVLDPSKTGSFVTAMTTQPDGTKDVSFDFNTDASKFTNDGAYQLVLTNDDATGEPQVGVLNINVATSTSSLTGTPVFPETPTTGGGTGTPLSPKSPTGDTGTPLSPAAPGGSTTPTTGSTGTPSDVSGGGTPVAVGGPIDANLPGVIKLKPTGGLEGSPATPTTSPAESCLGLPSLVFSPAGLSKTDATLGDNVVLNIKNINAACKLDPQMMAPDGTNVTDGTDTDATTTFYFDSKTAPDFVTNITDKTDGSKNVTLDFKDYSSKFPQSGTYTLVLLNDADTSSGSAAKVGSFNINVMHSAVIETPEGPLPTSASKPKPLPVIIDKNPTTVTLKPVADEPSAPATPTDTTTTDTITPAAPAPVVVATTTPAPTTSGAALGGGGSVVLPASTGGSSSSVDCAALVGEPTYTTATCQLAQQMQAAGVITGPLYPSSGIKRYEVALMIVRALHLPENCANNLDIYKDLDLNAPYIQQLCTANTAGIINGYHPEKPNDRTMYPAVIVTYPEFARMLVNGYVADGFKQVPRNYNAVAASLNFPVNPDDNWYGYAFQYLLNRGVVTLQALEQGFIHFQTPMTRGQVAQFLTAVLADMKISQ